MEQGKGYRHQATMEKRREYRPQKKSTRERERGPWRKQIEKSSSQKQISVKDRIVEERNSSIFLPSVRPTDV